MARAHVHKLEVDAEHERDVDALDDDPVLLELAAAEGLSRFAVHVCDRGRRRAAEADVGGQPVRSTHLTLEPAEPLLALLRRTDGEGVFLTEVPTNNSDRLK